MSKEKESKPRVQEHEHEENGYMLCGGIGGILGVLIGHPFDTVKVRLQTMPIPKPEEPPIYKNSLDCAIKIVKREGIKGLYKGMTLPIIAVGPFAAFYFLIYKYSKEYLEIHGEKNNDPLNYFKAGTIAGGLSAFVNAPGERIKCLLQIQDPDRIKYKGPIDIITKSYKKAGFRSIFRGIGITIARDIPSYGIFFATFEIVKIYLMGDSNTFSMGNSLLAGGIAGINYAVFTLPFDVIKSRLQTSQFKKYPGGSRDIFWELVKAEGVSGLFRGIIPILLRAFPMQGACFIGFDWCKHLCGYDETSI